MLDVAALPKPRLIEELSLDALFAARVAALAAAIDGWTPDEADPITKVLRLEAYNEFMLRQRVNETARQCLPAFANGTNLDHVLVPFLPDGRLQGENAVVRLKVTSIAALILQPGYLFYSADLSKRAALLGLAASGGNYVAGPVEWKLASVAAPQELIVVCEVQAPAFAAGNGLSGAFTICDPNNAVASITNVEQDGASFGGSDEAENDARFLRRAQYAPSLSSTAGSRRAYLGRAMGADARVMDVSVESPEPFTTNVYLLSGEGDGTADARMISRVESALAPLSVRPDSEVVNVLPAIIVHYGLSFSLVVTSEFQPKEVNQLYLNFCAWGRGMKRFGAYARHADVSAAILRGTPDDATTRPLVGVLDVESTLYFVADPWGVDEWLLAQVNATNKWEIACNAWTAAYIHTNYDAHGKPVLWAPYEFAGGLNG